MTMQSDKKDTPEAFSLVLGGPLYQFYLRTHLAKPPLKLCVRRIIVVTLLAWLPLLVLSIYNGTAISGVKVPFIYDIATHVRFLLALGLLIGAEIVVGPYIELIIKQFIRCDIVPEKNHDKFHQIIQSSLRLRDSVLAEVIILLIVFIAGNWVWREFSQFNVATWFVDITDHGPQFTLAGYWCAFISLPIFQFILLRWYFRIFIWYRFLWKVSRLPLHLNALHPDKAGGLAFLNKSVIGFTPILLAHSALVSGIIVNRIWHTSASLSEFKFEIIGIILYLILITITPLLFFSPQLVKAKRKGTLDYAVTASSYVNRFHKRWIVAEPKNLNELLGTPDIQALSDLDNSFDFTEKMRYTPFSRNTIMQIIIVAAAPILPLFLTMMPLEEMIKNLIQIIM